MNKPPFKDPKPHGFALIATLTLMILLSLIVIAYLSMTAIETRTTSSLLAKEEAKANARLALMIAIGELQRETGSDQRITATASIFDTSLEDHQSIDGVKNPHWTGVFLATHEDGTPLYTRNDDQGGLSDKRFPGGDASSWDGRSKAVTYLVSGNEGGRKNSHQFQDAVNQDLADQNSVDLVVKKFPIGDLRRVRVKKVHRKKEGRLEGAYAWWVRDLGVAAKINIADPYHDKQVNPGSPDDGGYYRLLASQASNPLGLDPAFDMDPDQMEKILSSAQLALLGGSSGEASDEYWHDLTTYGYGVLANTRTGKLKRNLSDYLNRSGRDGRVRVHALRGKNGTASPGLSDTDHLVGIPNAGTGSWWGEEIHWRESQAKRMDSAPLFSTLRNYARLADDIAFEKGSSHQIMPIRESSPNHASAPFDGYNNSSIKLKKSSTKSLTPIVTEAAFYYNLSHYPSTFGGRPVNRLRAHYYPRVTLWNPYNVSLQTKTSSIMMQLPGTRRVRVRARSGDIRSLDMHVGVPSGVMKGSLFFTLEATTLEPGECLVFSPPQSKAYSSSSVTSNLLTADQAPDATRCYYINGDRGVIAGSTVDFRGVTYQPYDFPTTPGRWRQEGGPAAEDVRLLFKDRATSESAFRSAPLIQAISGSPKVGAWSEQPIFWSSHGDIDMATSQPNNASLTMLPDQRTREAIRLRWHHEPESNLNNSGFSGSDAERLFSSAPMANWNLRAGFIYKNPYDNMATKEPFIHGIYSRDIGGPESAWSLHDPPMIDGKPRGNPFGYHQDALPAYIMYDIPREETGLVSMAQLQHAKITEYGWHPAYAIGNSFADPRMEPGQTVPIPDDRSNGGWNGSIYGHASGHGNRDYIANFARGWTQHLPAREAIVYDLSFELNHLLWDEFFLRPGNSAATQLFIDNPTGNPLPNSRLTLRANKDITPDDLDFHHAARNLLLNGAFNVNSTSVRAWKALLMSTAESGLGQYVFPRILNPPASAYQSGSDIHSQEAWAGYRELTEEEITRLSEKIVTQVKRRGPFLSLSDFINRRLVNDETGLMGTLQAAIDASGVNEDFLADGYEIDRTALPDASVNTNALTGIRDCTKLRQESKPDSRLAGIPAYLTQADLLVPIGPVLSARSDCFLIRTFGEAKNKNGDVTATAWCEAVVQRVPDPIQPDDEDLRLNPTTNSEHSFGRRYQIVSFRWLSQDEI